MCLESPGNAKVVAINLQRAGVPAPIFKERTRMVRGGGRSLDLLLRAKRPPGLTLKGRTVRGAENVKRSELGIGSKPKSTCLLTQDKRGSEFEIKTKECTRGLCYLCTEFESVTAETIHGMAD